ELTDICPRQYKIIITAVPELAACWLCSRAALALGAGEGKGRELERENTQKGTRDGGDAADTENLNYTSLLFPGKGHGPGSARDYENMKPGADYVNVDPKKKKVDFWACSSPVASKSIEYTEVKL
uniref:Uncharacterized protein n=1 Tax=Cairina moschata TaxID=8855 RepID=A0A8C3BXK6_CAIMO